jgi:hypothetical protein
VVLDVADVVDLMIQLWALAPGKSALLGIEVWSIDRRVDKVGRG